MSSVSDELLSHASKQAMLVAVKDVSQNIAKVCEELLVWHETGLLKGNGHTRRIAYTLNQVLPGQGLELVEKTAHQMALVIAANVPLPLIAVFDDGESKPAVKFETVPESSKPDRLMSSVTSFAQDVVARVEQYRFLVGRMLLVDDSIGGAAWAAAWGNLRKLYLEDRD